MGSAEIGSVRFEQPSTSGASGIPTVNTAREIANGRAMSRRNVAGLEWK
jgi:hypothetical protein